MVTSATNPSPRTPTGSMVWICGRCCRWILCRSWGIPPPCALVARVLFLAPKNSGCLEDSWRITNFMDGLLWFTSEHVALLLFFLQFSWCKTNSDQLCTQIYTTYTCHWLRRFISRSNLSGLGDRFIRNGLICDFSKLSWFLVYIRITRFGLRIYWIYWFRLVWLISSQTLEPKCWRFLRCWGVCQPSFP